MRVNPIAAGYRDLLQEIDRWFETTTNAHPGVIACRAGCSACCYGPFDISAADQLLLREGWLVLAADLRQSVLVRAADQVQTMQALAPGWNVEQGIVAL